jgi:hypothetical protein
MLTFDNSFCSCESIKNLTFDYAVNKSFNEAIQGGAESEPNGRFPIVLIPILAAVILAAAAIALLRKTHKNKRKPQV